LFAFCWGGALSAFLAATVSGQTICQQCVEDQVQPDDVQPGDYFGTGLSIDGSFAIVGASTAEQTDQNPDEGAAYVFEQIHGAWADTQRLIADSPQTGEMLGESAAISGDVAVIAAPRYDAASYTDAGRVLVFRRDPLTPTDQWAFETEFTEGNDAGNGHFFGGQIATSHQGVAVDGNMAVVGAPGSNGHGRAYVFTYDPLTDQWDDGS